MCTGHIVMHRLFFNRIDLYGREKPVIGMDDFILYACACTAGTEFSCFNQAVSWADCASCAHGQLRLFGIL